MIMIAPNEGNVKGLNEILGGKVMQAKTNQDFEAGSKGGGRDTLAHCGRVGMFRAYAYPQLAA